MRIKMVEVKPLEIQPLTKARVERGGFSTIDLLVWGSVVAVFLAFIAGAIYYLSAWKSKQSYLSDFKLIMTGLSGYYQTAYYYPGGDPASNGGWDWDINANYAYIPQKIIARGWVYACDSANRRITIATPPIDDTRVRSSIYEEFKNNCNEAGITDDNRVYCTLYDKPCGLENNNNGNPQ